VAMTAEIINEMRAQHVAAGYAEKLRP
jgi:hypothetical protein